jgi:hypothetical protein
MKIIVLFIGIAVASIMCGCATKYDAVPVKYDPTIKIIGNNVVTPLVINNTYSDSQAIIACTGKSMVPTLPNNSADKPLILKIEKLPWDELKAGMIVVYKHSTMGNVVHRIFYKINSNKWRVRGDNNFYSDNEYVTLENYIGVVKQIIKN